ncbi:MAG TPA: serine/threonine-protein kinase [Gemmatimonadales bacterium]|nr:serine/threonine-protein kinase [Gemmatimonadales bacterium]
MLVVERLQAHLAGRYDLRGEAGRGAMAVVYRAQDLKHDRPVALKVLRPELSGTLGPDRFLREIRIASHLSHPNILPVHDSGEVDGLLYYVMPFVAGESLRARLTREPQLPLEIALEITGDVAGALDYAHREGVIHRDIKPENILLQDGHAVVADFGLARAVTAAVDDDISSARLVVGTPLYMSPEQGAGEMQLDGRTDVYSLGCVLYEMLAGEPPFSGPSAQAILAKHLQHPLPPLRTIRPDLPPWVQERLERALVKVPAGRYRTAADFARGLVPPSVKHGRGRVSRLLTLGLLGAGLLASVLVGRQVAGRRGADAAPPRETAATIQSDPTAIAVLYFDSEGPDSLTRSIANGLTEDLIDQLGQVEALSVISANGVRPFRGRAAPLDSVVKALHVGTLVAGTVEGSEDSVRVTVRLVDAASGTQLDSRILSAADTGMLALRSRMVQDVAGFLRERLGQEIKLRELRSSTRDSRAWVLVRRVEGLRDDARSLFVSGDAAAARRALDTADSLLGRVQRLDPRWPDPIVLRGWLDADRIDMGDSAAAAVERWAPAGIREAERALARRPAFPPALELRGYLRFMQWDYAPGADKRLLIAAEQDLRGAAVPDNPSRARAWSTLSYLLLRRGSLAEANLAARRAYDEDAFLADAPSIVFRLYLTALMSRQWQAADQWCDQGHRRFADDWLFTFCRLTLLYVPGPRTPDVPEAWRLVRELSRLSAPSEREEREPRWQMLVAGVLARAGLRDSALSTLRSARRAGAGDTELDYYEAGVRALLGQRAEALTILDRYLRASPEGRAFVASDPVFQGLHQDPRFRAITAGPM